MKYIFPLFLFLIVSCAPATVTPPIVSPTEPPNSTSTIAATYTPVPATETNVPAIIPSGTPIPCNPRNADYCITNGHFILQRPILPPANDSVDVTYRYASTANGTREPHHGVEIGKDFGTPIHAAADGVVLFAGPDKDAVFSPWSNFYGNLIVIRHEGNLFTLYGHLSKIDVQAGETVTAGQKIGEMGQSGAATGSHLHFEVRCGDVEDYFSTMNPELWLMPRQGSSGAMAISVIDDASHYQSAALTTAQYSAANEQIAVYYLDTYDKTMAMDENAALSDLSVGRYRITLIHNGHLYERWVEVQSGKLTQVVLVVK